MKSDSDFMYGLNVSLRHLCLAVACGFGLNHFRRNTFSRSLRVFLFDSLFFPNVGSVFFVNVDERA